MPMDVKLEKNDKWPYSTSGKLVIDRCQHADGNGCSGAVDTSLKLYV